MTTKPSSIRRGKAIQRKMKKDIKRSSREISQKVKENVSKQADKAKTVTAEVAGKVRGENVPAEVKPQDIALLEGKEATLASTTWLDSVIESDKLAPSVRRVDNAVAFLTRPRQYHSENEAVETARGPIIVGLWIAIFVFVFLGGWAAFAPLDSAAIAPGSVVLDDNKKTIQHLEGGIISEILVKEGDSAEAGQPLIRLSGTTARARQEILGNQLRTAQATSARLIAERDGLEELTFSPELLELQDRPEVQEIMDGQKRLFESRSKAMKGQTDVLQQRIAQLRDEIEGLVAQEKAASAQIKLIKEEIETVQALVDKGQGLKPRLLSLQRKAAELEGNRGEFVALIARAEQAIAENNLQIINTENEHQSEVIALLRETQDTIADLQERVRASEDILERITVTAPQSGVITGLKFHTVGGVVGPGEPIMDIVPLDDRLVVEAQVDPRDIDVVHQGLKARVRLSAFKARFVPPIDGTVKHISADKFIDQAVGKAFYLARVEVDEEQLGALDNVDLYPGMPAEVLIVTGERTFLNYLVSPITDSFNRAFREQ